MDRRLSYRRGSPLLKPLPLLTKRAFTGLGSTAENSRAVLLPKIASILREHNVRYHSVDLVHRFHDDETTPEPQDVTLFIDGDLEKSSINNWDVAVQKLRNFLDESHLEQILVEMLDYKRNVTSSFAITNELYPHGTVESLYTSVKLYLKDLGLKWTTITLLYRGTELSDLHPTLLITALDLETEKWWSDALPQLEEMCLRVSPDLDVELLHGAVSFSHERHDVSLGDTDFGKNLQMGGSIGAEGSIGSGSIGAAVKLSTGSERGYTIRSPSDRDVALQKDSLNDQIATYINTRDRYVKMRGDVTEDISHIGEYTTTLEDELEKIPAEDDARNVGKLFASRQGVDRNGWIVDWSLTSLDNRFMTNEVPRKILGTRTIEQFQKTRSSTSVPLTTWMADKCISGCAVAKRGRTTGWTFGTINKYDTETLTDRAGNTIEGKAWSIFPSDTLGDGIRFMENGDSGSMVCLTEVEFCARGEPGVMVGLGFGTVNGDALMSPLSAIFADIEEQLNGVVVEPRKLQG
ncbi:MAG: hypothetical protein M1820_001448 [Bogoriella megaspora]|nr:MAG: hypothetical protein M1820_001448 [Bogoriella megaspora]